MFSRFEYALKRARFTTLEEGKAIPNWDAFADNLDKSGFRLGADQTLKDAAGYLNSNPPQKQIVKDGSLGWEDLKRGRETGTQWLLLLIRGVRNNLFHGGKFPLPDGPVSDPARDSELLQSSLIVLRACLEQNTKVRTYFWDSLHE